MQDQLSVCWIDDLLIRSVAEANVRIVRAPGPMTHSSPQRQALEISDGVFLLAGSLENAQGGALLAVKLSKADVTARVEEDPFVTHQVVEPEIISIAPSRMTGEFASLLA